MNQILLHTAYSLKEDLDSNGYIVLPRFLSKDRIILLNRFFLETRNEAKVNLPFFTTHWSAEKAYREKVNTFVQQQLAKPLKRHFSGFKCILGYYLYKSSNAESKVGLHQDWSLTDEKNYRGLILWIPLVDTHVSNGCFMAIPGSHRYFIQPRGSFVPPINYDLESAHLVNLPVRAGDAVVFDQRLVHASPPNLSNKDRLAVGIVLLPETAPVIHYFYSQENKSIKAYRASDSFLVDSFYDYCHQQPYDYILSFLNE